MAAKMRKTVTKASHEAGKGIDQITAGVVSLAGALKVMGLAAYDYARKATTKHK